jgi:signal transduction histidine kinase
LDEAGFGSAARWFVDGFARRSGIDAKLDMATEFPRLPDKVETALFRALQEALTNAHRHSHGSEVEIKVELEAQAVRLRVRDNGRGIPEGRLQGLLEGSGVGVGLAGMRERLRETGGKLDIQSGKGGTSINVVIPIPALTEESVRMEAD